jgi:hypothetical protein
MEVWGMWNMGTSTVVVRCHYGANKSMTCFIKENKDKIGTSMKASAPLNANISCVNHCDPSSKWKGQCIYGWMYILVLAPKVPG